MNFKPKGQISGISLAAFLQMSKMESTSCTLQIIAGQKQGQLFLSQGELIAAQTGNLTKIAAANEIIGWENPIIEIHSADPAKQVSIQMPLMNILMDALRLKDEKMSKGEQTSANHQETANKPASDPELPSEGQLLDFSDLDMDEPELSLDLEDYPQPLQDPSHGIASSGVKDEDIENKIKELQKQIAITCPICNVGKINEYISDKGSVYYACTHNTCNFITRTRPYPTKCPKCSNPFLIECITESTHDIGLKCPIKTCTFEQTGLVVDSAPAKPAPKRIRRIRRK